MAKIFEETFAGASEAEVLAEIADTPRNGVTTLTAADIGIGTGPGGGNCVNITGTGSRYLKYPVLDNFNFSKGAIEMKVQLNWDPRVMPATASKFLFASDWSTSNKLEIWLFDNYGIMMRPYFYPAAALMGSLPQSLEPYSLQSWRTTEWSLFQMFWDFSGATGNWLLYRFNDFFNDLIACPNAPSIESLGADKYFFIGSSNSPAKWLNGKVGYVAIYDDPEELLPGASIAAFPGGSTTTTALANAGATVLPVVSTKFFSVGKAMQVQLDSGYHNTTVAGVTPGVSIEMTNAIPAGRSIPSGRTINTKSYNPWIAGTLANVNALYPDGSGHPPRQATHTSHPTDVPIASPAGDVLFFKAGQLESVYPNRVPTAGEVSADFIWRGCLGQIEPVFFNVYSKLALTNVEVTYTALTGGSGGASIAKSHLDLRIVKNWFQGGRHGSWGVSNIPDLEGELLLEDDTVALETDTTLCINSAQKCPTLPALGYVKTAIDQYSSRQFLLRVNVPGDALPGNYSCTITLDADELGSPVTKTVTFTVLPFALRQDAAVERAVYYWPEYQSAMVSHMGLDPLDVFAKVMAKIREMGYSTLYLACYNTALSTIINDYIPLVAAAGFSKLVIYGWSYNSGLSVDANYAAMQARYTTALVDALVANGFEPILQVSDETDSDGIGSNKLKTASACAKYVHNLGTTTKAKVYTSWEYYSRMLTYVANLESYNAADYPSAGYPAGDAGFDYVDYNQSQLSAATALLGLSPYPKLTEYIETEGYYFQDRDGNQLWHREMIGYMAYISGLRPTASRTLPHAGLAWNEFIFGGAASQFGIVYPAQDDSGLDTAFTPVPTVNYYTHLEGVKDIRVLETWQWWYDRVKVMNPTAVAASKAVRDAIVALHTWDENTTRPYLRYEFSDWDDRRADMLDEITTLKAARGGGSLYGGVKARKIGGVSV